MLIRSAVPAYLPVQIRDHIIGAMALEIVEGKLRPADIRRRLRASMLHSSATAAGETIGFTVAYPHP
jgi:hypothetical protein